jgi:signal transduction histidine kinase
MVIVWLNPAMDRELTIRFSNDGPLIPAERKERIFEPFYRLKGNGKEKGTGIGLALARSLAELHAGTIYVDDPSDGLNNFVFTLPLRPVQDRGVNKNRTIFRYLYLLTKNT